MVSRFNKQSIKTGIARREKLFYENGGLLYTCEYKNDLRNGKEKRYDINGKATTVEVWENGVRRA